MVACEGCAHPNRHPKRPFKMKDKDSYGAYGRSRERARGRGRVRDGRSRGNHHRSPWRSLHRPRGSRSPLSPPRFHRASDTRQRSRSRDRRRGSDRNRGRTSRDDHYRPPRKSRNAASRCKDRGRGRKAARSSLSDDRRTSYGSVESERHFKGGPGDLLCDRYEISKEVGVGTFGRVFECYDSKRQKVVAVKVIRDVRKYYDSALIEADILQDVNGRGGRGKTHCVQLYAHFDYKRHFCLAFESMGKSLYDVIRLNNYKGFPLNMVRDFARQLLEALQFLHSMGLVHTDLKPENILLCTKELSRNRYGMSLPESTRIKLIDFGGATYTDDRKSSIINTRQYRAPEVILELGWCTPSDLWSAGCIVSELYEGELLFATHGTHEHLALMERCIGPFPKRMLDGSKVSRKYFEDVSGKVRSCSDYDSLRRVETMHKITDIVSPRDFPSGLVQLLEGLLRLDPQSRFTAERALATNFITMSG